MPAFSSKKPPELHLPMCSPVVTGKRGCVAHADNLAHVRLNSAPEPGHHSRTIQMRTTARIAGWPSGKRHYRPVRRRRGTIGQTVDDRRVLDWIERLEGPVGASPTNLEWGAGRAAARRLYVRDSYGRPLSSRPAEGVDLRLASRSLIRIVHSGRQRPRGCPGAS